MAISRLHVEGYRSVRSVYLKLKPVNVLIGANGCGKSNLYRSMFLMASAADGRLARYIADEGGMPSILWAGNRSGGPVRMNLGIRMENLQYEISLGLPQPAETAFPLDPRIKEEKVEFVKGAQRVGLIKRTKGFLSGRDDDGKKIEFPLDLSDSESVLSSLREPQRFPELASIRQELLSWRFYHQFRTDFESPLRRPQTGIFTPILSHDGADLAAALKSISETGGGALLTESTEEAFPGAKLSINDDGGRLSVALSTPGFQRAFSAQELSDGTLQYLCLLAALLSYRKPSLLALNEPETSIHPDLFRPLAKLIARAAKHSQLWITTHSRDLSDYIFDLTGYEPIELKKVDGATTVVGANAEGLINADD